MNRQVLLVALIGALSIGARTNAQHLDVLTQVVDGQLVTGAANYDNNTWLVGQRVFERQFLSNFRTNDPGFTGLETGNPLLEPGVQGLPSQTDVFFDIVPTTIDGQRANFWWWDGVDADDNGFDLDDVDLGAAPAGVTWNVFDTDFDLHTADGSDTVVPGALVQRTFSDGAIHQHVVMQVADNDGNSQTSPPQGVYVTALVLRAEGFEDSDPFFFVHRTSELTNEPRNVAADWVRENYDALIAEPLPGDFNFDGLVDAADYTVWRDGLGVDFVAGDYDTWRDNFGATTADAAPAIAVPEPASALLVATLLLPAAVARRRRSLPRKKLSAAPIVALAAASCALGCTQSEPVQQATAAEVPYVSSDEFDELIANADGPTLVEFCVPVGCFRCDRMNPSINELADDAADGLTVRRVNLNIDRKLAANWGVTVCPTYVVIAGGKEVGRAEFPTSPDLISALVP